MREEEKKEEAFLIVGGDSFLVEARIGVLVGRRRKIAGKEIFLRKLSTHVENGGDLERRSNFCFFRRVLSPW